MKVAYMIGVFVLFWDLKCWSQILDQPALWFPEKEHKEKLEGPSGTYRVGLGSEVFPDLIDRKRTPNKRKELSVRDRYQPSSYPRLYRAQDSSVSLLFRGKPMEKPRPLLRFYRSQEPFSPGPTTYIELFPGYPLNRYEFRHGGDYRIGEPFPRNWGEGDPLPPHPPSYSLPESYRFEDPNPGLV